MKSKPLMNPTSILFLFFSKEKGIDETQTDAAVLVHLNFILNI